MFRLNRRGFLLAAMGFGVAGPHRALGGPLLDREGAQSVHQPLSHQPRRLLFREVRTMAPVVALTFDDGPHPELTPALLDILKAYRQRATFYVIGQNARRYPAIVERIVAEGHDLGNHSFTHPVLSTLSDRAVLHEIDRTQEVLFQIVGMRPPTMRPPYGALTPRQAQVLLTARGLSSVLWSVDPEDWRRPGPQTVAERLLRGARPGAILLAHDIHPGTIRAAPAVFEGLRQCGLTSVTLAELLGQRPLWGEQPKEPRLYLSETRRGALPSEGG